MIIRKLAAACAAAGIVAVALTGCTGSGGAKSSSSPAATQAATQAAGGGDSTSAYCDALNKFNASQIDKPDAAVVASLQDIQAQAPAEVKDDWSLLVDMMDLYVKYDGDMTKATADADRLQQIAANMSASLAALDKETKADCGKDFGFGAISTTSR